jgi:hypothetical protein
VRAHQTCRRASARRHFHSNNFGRSTMTKNVTLTADTDHIGIGAADPPEAPIDH